MTSLSRRGTRAVALVTVSACMCLLLGCSGGTGDVSGTVTFNGKPLQGGTVTFASADGGPNYTGIIKEDGTYTVSGVRSGPYKVCVETESLKAKAAGGGPPSGGSGSKGGPPGKGGPPAGSGPPGGSGPPDIVKAAATGKIKAGPPGGSEEPEDVKAMRGKDGLAMRAENAKRYVAIPPQYGKPESTDLTFTAGKGAQTFDIALK